MYVVVHSGAADIHGDFIWVDGSEHIFILRQGVIQFYRHDSFGFNSEARFNKYNVFVIFAIAITAREH